MPVIQSDFPGAQCTRPVTASVSRASNIRGDLNVLCDFVSATSTGSEISATPTATDRTGATGAIPCSQCFGAQHPSEAVAPPMSRKENLTLEGRQALTTLLRANKRLNTAYLLKESFGQLWSYEREGWARRFFENWRAALKWQRLKPYEKFADMIDRHWDGIAAYCKPENKVSLGFVEGLNNKIRVIQRRAYGLRDEDYLRLKILTCRLPML